MEEWIVPENAESLKSDLKVSGRGLGKINRKFFETATWAAQIHTFVGQRQYGKFVEAMMNRIRFEESDPCEIKRFVSLLASPENWDLLRVAQRHIPELEETCLHPNEYKNFQLCLVFQQLKKEIHERAYHYKEKRDPTFMKYMKGLSFAEQAYFEKRLFGQYAGRNKTPAMERLLESTLELAFPQRALEHKLAEAKAHGTDIERDSEGLPTCLLMPGQARAPGIWHQLLENSAGSTKVPSSSTAKEEQRDEENENSPSKLLAGLDGANDVRVSKGESKCEKSKGKLRKNTTPAAKASGTCGTNSRDALQFSCDRMLESSQKQVSDPDFDFLCKAQPPLLAYLCNLPATHETTPQQGPIYPKGDASKAMISRPTSKSCKDPSITADPLINNVPAATTKPNAAKSSNKSKVCQAAAEDSQRLQRPRRRKSVQGMCPTIVVKEAGTLVTYTSPSYGSKKTDCVHLTGM